MNIELFRLHQDAWDNMLDWAISQDSNIKYTRDTWD